MLSDQVKYGAAFVPAATAATFSEKIFTNRSGATEQGNATVSRNRRSPILHRAVDYLSI